jgi:hypothetical protein
LNEEAHAKYAVYCKEHSISMSKQINMFIESQIADDLDVKDNIAQL